MVYGLLNKAVISFCSNYTNKFSKNLLLDYVLSSTFGQLYSFNIVLNDDQFLEDFDFNFISRVDF